MNRLDELKVLVERCTIFGGSFNEKECGVKEV